MVSLLRLRLFTCSCGYFARQYQNRIYVYKLFLDVHSENSYVGLVGIFAQGRNMSCFVFQAAAFLSISATASEFPRRITDGLPDSDAPPAVFAYAATPRRPAQGRARVGSASFFLRGLGAPAQAPAGPAPSARGFAPGGPPAEPRPFPAANGRSA